MKNLLKVIAVIACLGMSVSAFAQQKISGTITDEKGPVAGATVMVEGTDNGAVSDIEGKYTLSVPVNSTLIVSCIGYADQTVVVEAGKTVYNFVISEDVEFLDDVVVIGYQTVRRRDLTGAVASITGKELTEAPVANAAEALQGKLPGVRVTASSGAPGATVSIRVRGGNSITQSNEPLVLIDGIAGKLENIPADQIESIDVLKDAASTAIYGSRGANGVILVTTKGAKEGKVSVRYNMYYQYRNTQKMYDVMDAQDFVYWQWTYATAYNETLGKGVSDYYGVGSQYGNHYAEYANVQSHNHMYDVLKPSGSWNHDITLSGGTDATNYMISFNYMKDNGTRIKNQRERYNVSIKLNQKIGKKLTFSVDTRYTENQGIGSTDRTTSYGYRPIDKPLGSGDASGLGIGSGNVDENYDPILAINNSESYSHRYNLRATTGLTWNAFKGFVAKTELTLNRGWSRSESWNGGQGIAGSAYKTATISNGHSTSTRWTNTLNYTVQGLGKNHSLNFLVGHEMMTDSSVSSSMTGYGYPKDLSWAQTFAMFDLTDRELGKDTYTNTVDTPSNSISFFGRANYSLMGRYLFTATFRADGSSKFAPNNRWGIFPAGAFAWRISDESWMKSTKSWMDELKFRISYGTSGSDGISANLWRETWSSDSIQSGEAYVPVYKPASMLANPDLKWETTISRNTGFDFSFFKSRLRGSLEFYWNTTKDLLFSMPIDSTTGFSSQYQNVGQTSNKGIELSLNAGIVKNKDFQLSVNLTYAYNHNNLDYIDPSANANRNVSKSWGGSDAVPTYDYLIEVGRPIGLVNVFVAEGPGYYTVDDFIYENGVYTLKPGITDTASGIANYPSYFNSLKPSGQNAFPGSARFKDINNDGIADTKDTMIFTEMAPHHTGGFGIQANWKNFDFSANFAYQLDGYIYNAAAMGSLTFANKETSAGANRLAYVSDAWKSFGVDSKGDLYLVTSPDELKALNKNTKYAVAYSEHGYATSQFIEPGAFLRLNNLSIGYTLPHKVLDKIKIQNLRVYVTGANMFTLTKYSGLDPEVGNSTLTPGYDNGNYPRPITFTAGLNVTF